LPAGVHEVATLAAGGSQQLEPLEAGHRLDELGPRRAPLIALRSHALRHLDGVDLDDTHGTDSARCRVLLPLQPSSRTPTRWFRGRPTTIGEVEARGPPGPTIEGCSRARRVPWAHDVWTRDRRRREHGRGGVGGPARRRVGQARRTGGGRGARSAPGGAGAAL